MKKIIFIRHGKAENSSESGKDFDRKLSIKGRLQANHVGKSLLNKNIKIDHIISSNSARTTETIALITTELGYPLTQIHYEPTLYLTELKNYLKICFNIDEKHNLVAICGHNFGISDCLNYFTDENIQLTTAGTVIVSFDVNSWKEISAGTGKLDLMI